MKNVFLITAILIVNLSFAQSTDANLKSISAADLEERHFKNHTSIKFGEELKTEVFVLKDIKSINNSEGKFPFYKEFKNTSFDSETKTIVKAGTEINNVISNNLEVNANIALVNKILMQNYINNSLSNKTFNGDTNLDMYKNYAQKDEFNIALYKKDAVELELGNNIYQSIHKIFKTELDKTLDHSLNLLTFNF
ncbi:hypothetical protein [uncultured Polaribacter sp.]|uniref:hypothetical protein n=1 Tax=uncultured Polaribacter sp. TaxID=174711 RepID=UPI00261F70D5|nr:hypothetical protein [uncultured Polaribacter sp.]